MKKNKTITALCVSLLALSSSNSLVYAATTSASSASSQTKVATSSQATSSSSTSATSSQSGQAQSSQNASTSSQTVSVSSLSGNTLSSAALTQSLWATSTREELAPGVWYDSNHSDMLEITSADGLINWISHVNSGDWKYLNVQLDTSIDLSGKSVPTLNKFERTFDGKGNSIKNWNYGGSSSSAINENSGTFRDLTIDTTISGTNMSFINNNTGHLDRVHFNVKMEGTDNSFIKTNSGYLNDVEYDGVINGSAATFIGVNKGTISNMIMDGSLYGSAVSLVGVNNNNGTVNVTLAKQAVINGVDVSVITLDAGTSNITWSPGCQVNDHITNVKELQRFSFLVATGQNKINGILDNDIDAGKKLIPPIGYFNNTYRIGIWDALKEINNIVLHYGGVGNILQVIWDFLFGKDVVYTTRYEGTFDGNGHTISNFYSDGDYASFMYENAGTVKRLEITGKVSGYASGFISKNDGSIQDCVVDMDFDSGSMWRQSSGFTYNENNGTIRNTFYIGSLDNNAVYTGNEKGVHDFYYYPISGGNDTRNAIKATKEAVESGKITQLLNDTRAANSDWSWVQVVERRVPIKISSRPGFNNSSNTVVKQPADKPTINNIDRTDKSLRVNAQLDGKFGEAEYLLKDSAGHKIGDWQSSNEFTKLSPDTEYTVYVKYKGNDKYLASDAVSQKVKTKREGPKIEITEDDVKRSTTSLEVTKQFDSSFGDVRYQLRDTQDKVVRDWQTEPKFADLKPGEKYQLVVQTQGNDDYMPSAEASVTVKTVSIPKPDVTADNVYGGTDSFNVKFNLKYGQAEYELTDNNGKVIRTWQASSEFKDLDLASDAIYQIHVRYHDQELKAFSDETIVKIMKAPTVTIASKNANSLKVADLADTDKYGQAEYARSPSDLTAKATDSTIGKLDSDTNYIVYARRAGKGDYPPSAIGQVVDKTDIAHATIRIPTTIKTGESGNYVTAKADNFSLGYKGQVNVSISGGISDGQATLTRQNDPAGRKTKTKLLIDKKHVGMTGNSEVPVVSYTNEAHYGKSEISFTDPREVDPLTPTGFYTGNITFKVTYNEQ
ncbi:hypothetical protein [Ligilactobacillus agilis]|nr:hypothetical protein [Ligilactobacillus agilis]OXC08830.1 hypothetical protein AYP75_07955 [Ligilactobacillus agilis]OXS50186.1 hypothetical protein AYP73_06980 [Ligilactobacillus agilis]